MKHGKKRTATRIGSSDFVPKFELHNSQIGGRL